MDFKKYKDFFVFQYCKVLEKFSFLFEVKNKANILGALVAVFIFGGAWLWFGVYQPSNFFPIKKVITIPEGSTVSQVGDILKKEQVVRNSLAFRFAVDLVGDSDNIKAGDYYFTKRLNLFDVVKRVTNGVFGLEPIKVVVPEGATTYQMAEIFDDKFEKFDTGVFLMFSKGKEGYLFPDTYLFLPNVSTEEILNTMERTFYERLRGIEGEISDFGKPVHEVITMASLLEKEARNFDERRMIAGILWKRLEIGMPLQVDAVFGYIEKRETFNPKFSDLEVDSPYNIYKNTGLPPGPIGSPSLEAIEAAVTPKETDALFYLHGKDGVLRIAKTYDEHLKNKRRYLN